MNNNSEMRISAFSVVIPAYNAEEYLEACLDSVRKQTFQNLEILVIDDCSTDRTSEIVNCIAKQDTRVRYLCTEKNSGTPSGPRNLGIKEAKHDWIAFLDADDIWHPKKLETQQSALLSSTAQFCSTEMIDFSTLDELVFENVIAPKIENVGFSKQLVKFRTPTSSVVVKKSLMLKHLFNEDLRFKAREDLDCWLHCLEESGTSIKIKHPLVGYRISPNQISGDKFVIIKRHLLVLKEYRFQSGRKLAWLAYIFTFTHVIYSIYYRLIKRGL